MTKRGIPHSNDCGIGEQVREGYWINYKTGKVVQIYEHESDIRDSAIARKLGVPAKVFSEFGRYTVGIDRERFLLWLMSQVPLMRVRGHGGLYDSYEFSAKSDKMPYLAIVRFSRLLCPTKLMNISNLTTGKSEQILAYALWERERKHGRKVRLS